MKKPDWFNQAFITAKNAVHRGCQFVKRNAAKVTAVGIGVYASISTAMAQTNIATLIEEAESTWGSIFPIMCAITLGGIGIAFVKRFKRS